MDACQQSIIAAEPVAGHVGHAMMQEIAKPVKDDRVAGGFDAAYHMGVMADDKIDTALVRRQAPPIGDLLGVSADLALDTVMDRKYLVVGRRSRQPLPNLVEIGINPVRDLPRLFRSGAVALQIVACDPYSGEADGGALHTHHMRPARLLAVVTNARMRQQAVSGHICLHGAASLRGPLTRNPSNGCLRERKG